LEFAWTGAIFPYRYAAGGSRLFSPKRSSSPSGSQTKAQNINPLLGPGFPLDV
jgi:hypothetical protein